MLSVVNMIHLFKGEGEAWGAEGDIMLDEEGNPDIDENEILAGDEGAEEGGWDVRAAWIPPSDPYPTLGRC